MNKRNDNTKKMVLMAMLAAVALLLVATIRIPVVLFLKYEPKDVAVTIGGFLLGPFAALIISAVVCLIEMVTISDTGIIGCIMNLISTASFACTAALIYKKIHNIKGAIFGLLCGSLVMVGVMLLWNWLVTPLYMTGTSRTDIAGMLLPVFLPFNALKAGFNSAFTLCLYKPLTGALRRAKLLPQITQQHTGAKLWIYILGIALLISCLLFWLALRGII